MLLLISEKDSMDVVFIVLAGQHKIVGSWSKSRILTHSYFLQF